MTIEPGASAEIEMTVTADRTADAMGNKGVQVLATPYLIGLLEDVAQAIMRPHLAPGGGSVGTMVEMRHLAATPVGMRVRARATLLETDGRRFLFQVEAWDEVEKVAEGRHERFGVPNLQKFLDRALKKGKAMDEHERPDRP
jgi:predicted thioesterase